MSKAFHPYSEAHLPEGFKYPSHFLEIAATGLYPDIYPWWFIDADSRAGELSYSNRNFDGRNLIPFAKVDDDRNDIACFDGEHKAGNPAVFILVLDGSGRRYEYADFEDWLKAAEKDAQRWHGFNK